MVQSKITKKTNDNQDLCCYICGSNDYRKREGSVRDNPNLDVLECQNCGLVFLSSFDHINDHYYKDSGMHDGNVNLDKWLKETSKDDERRFTFLADMMENKDRLDFGCGNGGFLMRAKSIARTVAGVEPDRSVEKHFINEGIQLWQDIDDVNASFDIITMFHVLEHIPDPVEYLQGLAYHLNPNGKIIVEVPSARDALLTLYNNNAFANFTYWSCHLFLYDHNTLEKLANKAGLKLYYIKQVQRYPLSNHLYWLARNKPGGHKEWGFLDSPELHSAYEKQLASLGVCDTLIACFEN